MSPKKQRRLAFAVALMVAGVACAALILVAIGENKQYFRSPSDLATSPIPQGQTFRLGGLVETGSVVRSDGLEVTFKVTDGKTSVPVTYTGSLPDLFREGQGIIATGTSQSDGVFAAREVLAKHDEKYMPPEVVEALKRSGHWEEGGAAPSGL